LGQAKLDESSRLRAKLGNSADTLGEKRTTRQYLFPKRFSVKPGEKFHDNAVVALAVFWIDSYQRRALYPVLYHHLVWTRGLFCGAFSVYFAGILFQRPIVYMDPGFIVAHLSLVPGVKTQNGG